MVVSLLTVTGGVIFPLLCHPLFRVESSLLTNFIKEGWNKMLHLCVQALGLRSSVLSHPFHLPHVGLAMPQLWVVTPIEEQWILICTSRYISHVCHVYVHCIPYVTAVPIIQKIITERCTQTLNVKIDDKNTANLEKRKKKVSLICCWTFLRVPSEVNKFVSF
jgi:hypothetical protein